MSEVKRYIIGRNGLPEFHDSGEYVATSDYDALSAKLAMAEDAAEKGDAARQQCGGMEMEIQELKAKLAELEKQEPLLHINPLVVDELLGRAKRSPGGLTWSKGRCGSWTLPLYAAPVAQAQHSVPVPVVTPEMVMAAMAVFRLDASPFKSMEAALIAALRKAAAPNEKRSCEYAGCCSTAHPGTSLCIAHHSKKVQEQLLAAAPGKEGV